MGEYFYILNLDKKEYLHPHQLGAGLKLMEICFNPASGVLVYLLAQSTDYVEYHKKKNNLTLIGSWAGDKILIVGDYDESKLYEEAGDNYKNISLGVRTEYERFTNTPLKDRWDKDTMMQPDIVLKVNKA